MKLCLKSAVLSAITILYVVDALSIISRNEIVQEFDHKLDSKPFEQKDSNRGRGQIYPNDEYAFVDANDVNVVDAAHFAVNSINRRSNSMYMKTLVKVMKAGSKVVAGLDYNMTIQLLTTSCHNSEESLHVTLEKCPAHPNHETETCSVQVWDRVWMKPRYILASFSCSQDSAKDKTCDREEFQQFKDRYQRFYDSEEEERRFTIFCSNMKKARYYQRMDQGDAVYGATQFADLSEDEFKKHLSSEWDLNANDDMKKAAIPNLQIPPSFDWRDEGVVTPVKNQGSCGSCWAFSTTGNIEGQWAIKNKQLFSLSEQELVDCDKVDHGCGGGLPSNAYKAIMKLGGLETEKDYPYEGSDDKCVFKKSKAVVKVNGSVSISKDENDMAAWLVKNGPISIGINAFAMQFYFGGIAHPWRIFCNPSQLDHGVLIVGYGIQDNEPYWIIKNSWGEGWGNKGYYYIYRGDGSCGLNNMCTSAEVP